MKRELSRRPLQVGTTTRRIKLVNKRIHIFSGAAIANKIPPPKFVANKPFLYFIVNKPTKSIVFAGRVTVPPLASQ
jgi:hypothetical protein